MAELNPVESLEYFKGKENAFVAYVETTSTATAAHAVGTYFWKGGKLYKATSNIAVGNTIAVGTNCALTRVCDEISSMEAIIEGGVGLSFTDQNNDGNVVISYVNSVWQGGSY